jgi:POT family proton-dependent oligopeptide transporter
MTVSTAAANVDTSEQFLGHPKGLYVCFATEMWERFSFYGMKFLLLLYLTKYHLFSDEAGYDVLGAYAGLVYALPLIGGLVADRYLGMRKAVIFGAILLVLGHTLMAFEGSQAIRYAAGTVLNSDLTLPDNSVLVAGTLLKESIIIQDRIALNILFLALAFITIGVGFLKPNISTIVGKLYPDGDNRRDSGFTIFYMGINLGSFSATFLCGWLGETYGWGYGFGAAGIGMLFGLVAFIRGQAHLMGHAEPSNPAILKESVLGPINREWSIYLLSFLALGLMWFVLQHEPIVHMAQNSLLVIALCGIPVYAFFSGSRIEFQRTLVLMALILSTVVFWALFEQSAGSMTLYADRLLDRQMGDTEIKASMFGGLNSLFIILCAPILAYAWTWLAKKNLEPSTPAKFAFGIIQAGLGFGALVLGAQLAGEDGKVAMIWLVLAYFIHTTGELCLSPVGLSAVTKLSISRVVGVSMGTWFLAIALSETLASRLGKMAAISTADQADASSASALATYTQLYEFLMWTGLIAGLVLLIITPLLKKGMHGIK